MKQNQSIHMTFNNSRIRMMNYKHTKPISQNQHSALWLMNNCVSLPRKLWLKVNNLMSVQSEAKLLLVKQENAGLHCNN